MNLDSKIIQYIRNDDPYTLAQYAPTHPLAEPLLYISLDRIPESRADIIPLFVRANLCKHEGLDLNTEIPNPTLYTSVEDCLARKSEFNARVAAKKATPLNKRVLTILRNPFVEAGTLLAVSAIVYALFQVISTPLALLTGVAISAGLYILINCIHNIFVKTIYTSVYDAYNSEPAQQNKPKVVEQFYIFNDWISQFDKLERILQSLKEECESKKAEEGYSDAIKFIEDRIGHLRKQAAQLAVKWRGSNNLRKLIKGRK